MPVRVKGCHHCSRRRINCDRNEPQCRKCVNANLECSGLGIRYRWTPTAVSTAGDQALRQPRSNKTKRRRGVTTSPSSKTQITNATALSISKGRGLLENQSNDIIRENEVESEQLRIAPTLYRAPASLGPISTILQRHCEDFWAINYCEVPNFCGPFHDSEVSMLTQILPVGEEISQWICPFRTYNNEFKTVLVPFALSSPEVLDALFAASFHRLAYYGRSEFHEKAETFKSSAITGLMNGSGQIPNSEYHQLAAIAVVIVLIYDDMISAQDYFRNLTPVLLHLIATVDLKSARNQTLARFLEEQLGLLLILVLPYMAPDDKTVDKIYRFLEKFAMADGGHKSRPSLAFCLRQSVTVWLRKVKDPNADVDGILEDMRWRLEYYPDLPSFDHYLTWVYFNCAASASKKTLRDFFICRLNWHTTTFGFKNVSLMVDFLQVLWENEQTWPSLIQFHNEYICA